MTTTLVGIGFGFLPALAELVGGPKAKQLVAPRLGLEPELLVMREFLLEIILALVESAHAGLLRRMWTLPKEATNAI